MITRKRTVLTFLLLLLIAGLGIIGFRVVSKLLLQKNGQVTLGEIRIPVAVIQVQRKSIEETLILTGDVRGLNEARVYPKVGGRLLRKIRKVGDLVKRDEVVALVDRNEPALQFAAAEVTSPLDGVLTRYFIDLGEAVTSVTPICEVADISPIKIVVNVSEKDLPNLKLGQLSRFTSDAYPNQVFSGRVAEISEALSLASRSAQVEIYSDNPGQKLKPGMFAKVEIVLSVHQEAVVVPRDAVAELGGNYYAFVVQNQVAHRRDLKVGIIKPDELEIRTGLNPAETLVTLGWHNLTEGSKVVIVEEKSESAKQTKKD